MLTFLRAILTLGSLGIFASVARAQCPLETQELEPLDGRAGDGFGYRVEHAGNLAVIASPFTDELGVDSGSVTVWEREPGSIWKLTRKLVPSDGAELDYFAYGLALDGTNVLVGAPLHDHSATDAGAVY